MIDTLFQFANTDLCSASLALLDKLGMKYTRGAEESLKIYDLFNGKSTPEALDSVTATYFVALIDERTFENSRKQVALDTALDEAVEEKYKGMFVFAIDVKPEANLTRTMAATLTRAFNRLAVNKPVVLFIRQSETLSIATCERSNYAQTWREGEKIGKVSVLKGINCKKPHPGHINTLMMLQAPTTCNSFSLLHEHWKEVFSTELLTKKFYTELSDWYAWAIQVMRFPNHLGNEIDNKKYNAENGIRLVTRLIFVWFLKQKKLIPEAFFDQNSLKQIIKDFDPTQKEHSLFGYMSRESKYYKAILQNLFFAMLNCPLTEEGRNEVNVRGFRKYDEDGNATGANRGDHHLLRYKKYFTDPDEFLRLANMVPFLNGGLFECLDDVDNKFYLDGFSENEKVVKSLCVPDYLFFGEQNDIDLSEWYDDNQKHRMKVRGIIDILKSYQFTIEENTPSEQEVSLDPELLGKVFENLLASYNPETNKTARKSTGSYYTPREIVQYMVDESLVAYLKEKVSENMEELYRQLLDYSETEIELKPEKKQQIMSALYQCKVLDPACGSGAFPMGMLQQMVHVLAKLDPDNVIWKQLIEEKSKQELADSLNNYSKEERDEVQADINRSFDLSQNAPAYARKLYLIENCIYGVDIQTTAIQISKLRCFISLVVDQKVNNDPVDNYGIRPLPNLEARFVAANTLISVGSDLSLANTEKVIAIKSKLKDANHRIFNAKTMRTKRKWKDNIITYREELCKSLEETGFITHDEASLVSSWDMFNQNVHAKFFNPAWMFGISSGFNIVIGNPPYIKEYTNRTAFDGFREASPYYMGKMDLWYGFACHGIDFLKSNGVLCFIAQNNWTTSGGAKKMRNKIIKDSRILQMIDFNTYMVFESADIQTMIMLFQRNHNIDNYSFDYRTITHGNEREDMLALLAKQKRNTKYLSPIIERASLVDKLLTFSGSDKSQIFEKLSNKKSYLKNDEVAQGIVFPQDYLNRQGANKLGNKYPVGTGIFGLNQSEKDSLKLNDKEEGLIKPYFTTEQIHRYYTEPNNTQWLIYTDSSFKRADKMKDYPNIKSHLDRFIDIYTSDNKPYGLHRCRKQSFFQGEKIISLRKCVERPCFSYSDFDCFVTQTFFSIKTSRWNMKFLTGVLNSQLVAFWLRHKGKMQGNNYQVDKEPLQGIPLPVVDLKNQQPIIALVDKILAAKKADPRADTGAWETEIDILVYLLYGLTWDEMQIVENSSVQAALPVNESTYTKWLERYQKDGTLPSEEEMEHMA